ncbi:MAG: nucleotidyltransferase family protein [Pseudomonadota bacterium]
MKTLAINLALKAELNLNKNISLKEEIKLLELINKNKLAGLIYKNISKTTISENLPKVIIENCKESYRYNQRIFWQLSQKLDIILSVFNREKIEVTLIRGLDLINQAYEDPGLREIGDIDLIIKENDYTNTKKILQDLGFNEFSEKSTVFIKDEIMIDIHRSCFNLDRLKFRKTTIKNVGFIEKEKEEKTLLDNKYTRYTNELQIVISAWHAQKHSYEKLSWFFDIIFLIKNNKINWQKTLIASKTLGLEKPLYFAIAWISTNTKNIIPLQVLKENKAALGKIETFLLGRLLENSFPQGAGSLLFALNSKNKLTSLMYILEAFFSADEIEDGLKIKNVLPYFNLIFKRINMGLKLLLKK